MRRMVVAWFQAQWMGLEQEGVWRALACTFPPARWDIFRQPCIFNQGYKSCNNMTDCSLMTTTTKFVVCIQFDLPFVLNIFILRTGSLLLSFQTLKPIQSIWHLEEWLCHKKMIRTCQYWTTIWLGGDLTKIQNWVLGARRCLVWWQIRAPITARL